MLRYTIRRLLWILPVIVGVSLIIFVLMDLVPGNIVDTMDTSMMTENQIAELYERYDLDKSVLFRYSKYMLNLVRGDLGVSQATGRTVWREFAYGFPYTMRLTFFIFLLGVAIAIPMGIFAAKYAGTIWDTLITGVTIIGMSMPSFWVGLLLIMLFSARLDWLPPIYTKGNPLSYLMPVVAGGISMAATITRQTRSAMLDTSKADYLRTARAKGVSERGITWKHALRNALIPIVTQVGVMLAVTIAGGAVIETVFALPGTGKLTVQAVQQRDTTMACGLVILTCILYVLILLAVDLIYALVDPRIKAQFQRKVKSRRKL